MQHKQTIPNCIIETILTNYVGDCMVFLGQGVCAKNQSHRS